MTKTTTPEFRPCDSQETLRQIGYWNLAAICGGRVQHRDTGLTLLVGHGYSVTIDLDWNDTYVVRRVFTRAGKSIVKGERREVYFDELGEVAYKASCYLNNYTPDQW